MSNSLMKLWSEQSAEGKLKLTVESPLSQQGVVCLDDGAHWLTYRPDENKVIVQSSPRLSLMPAAARVNLAEKNYELKALPGDWRVAGRRAQCLVAVPKASQMPERRYCIDEDKQFLLRMEVISKGNSKLMLDTQQIEFNADIPDEDFVLQPTNPAELQTFESPATINLGGDAKRQLGFEPAVPSNLPFGFKVENPQMGGSKNDRFAAVRISDGLVNATVYEWNKKNARNWQQGDCKNDREAHNVQMRLVGELPDTVLVRVLDTFVREALKHWSPLLMIVVAPETSGRVQTLNGQQENEKSAGGDSSSAETTGAQVLVIELVSADA